MKALRKHTLKLFLLLLIYQNGLSQVTYHYEWFSADSKHLPQNSVKSIAPDKYGFIWLSTENGIVRYDGQNFKIYNSENLKGLTSNRMLLFTGSIEKDSIIVLNERSETLLIHERAVKNMDTIKYHKKIHTLLSRDAFFKSYYKGRQKPLAISVQDRTYIFTRDSFSVYNSNYKLTEQKKYAYNRSENFFVTSGNLYILNDQNEYALFSEIHQSFKKFGHDFTKKIKLYSNNITQQTFLYSDDKLFYLKKQNGQLSKQLVFENFNFETNNIVSAYYDEKNEILYLGSSNKGLLVVKQNDFNHNITSNEEASGNSDIYYALTQFGNDKVLTSTGEFFGKNGEKGIINIGPYSDKFMIVIDNNNDIWTKNANNIYRFTKKSNYQKHDHWHLDVTIRSLIKGVNGHIYIGIYDDDPKRGAIYSINPNAPQPSPTLIKKLNFPPTEMLDLDGKVLLCGSWRGLYKLHLSSKKVEQIKGISSTTNVRSIYASGKNEIWIGTYNDGFYLYRNGKITHMPKDRNGYLLTTHCMVEDKQGIIWITTNKGLFAVKKQDLLDYADNKAEKIYYQLFDKNSGFLNNEFNGGCNPCGVNLNQETMFFPSMDGVVYFNPERVLKRQPNSAIYLDEIEVDSTTYKDLSKLVFDRKFGKIKFFISSPFFGTPYNQNIETRLEGPVVQNWTPMTETNVSFSTLPPGDYKLSARKLSGFGSKYVYKDIYFSITPAFWQTGWFTVLLVILGLLIIYLSFKLRIRYIKHKNIQLEKQVVLRTQQLQTTVVALRKTKEDLSVQVKNHKNLIKTITHDIKSPLKFIALTGRYLYNNLEKAKPISKEDIKAIHTSSSQLYHFVDNFLEYAKETDLSSNESEPYSLNELIKEKTDFFKNIATAAKTVIKNEVDTGILIKVNRHLLSIILHNLLDNALKNTFEGTIWVKASTSQNILSITVKDTGTGMSEELVSYYMEKVKNSNSKPNGMGLHMIGELLTITGGTLDISSEKNNGTSITISFLN